MTNLQRRPRQPECDLRRSRVKDVGAQSAASIRSFSFSEWLAHTPEFMAHLKIDRATFDAIPKKDAVIMPLS
jgi:hypothetical protein